MRIPSARIGIALVVLLFPGVLAAPPVGAQSVLLPTQAATIADTVTLANPEADYRRLLEGERQGLIASLQAFSGAKLNQELIDRAQQVAPLANVDWLKGTGYDFAVKDNQEAGIKTLVGFTTLPRWILQRSDEDVAAINHAASPEQQEHALVDADAIAYLYFIPEALGPRLGNAFLRAYQKGEIGKAAALLKASEISTGGAKAFFNYPRPFLIDGNTIRLVQDQYVAKDGAPYSATGGAFPSGHTNTGFTDALLLAVMLPERFLPLIDRGAGYGYSRVVLGVHYPLDVMGSRVVVTRNVVHFLNDPAYRKLFDEARTELRQALEKECAIALAECAKSAGAADPWADPRLRDFYAFTMTYGLPQAGTATVPMQVPEGAEALLETLLPETPAAQRRELLQRTSLPSGYPLDSRDKQYGFWSRLDLYEAGLAAAR